MIFVDSIMQNGFILPDGSISTDPGFAAERWAEAFYKAKDALSRIRDVTERILRKQPVICLDEILAECDSVLMIGDQMY